MHCNPCVQLHVSTALNNAYIKYKPSNTNTATLPSMTELELYFDVMYFGLIRREKLHAISFRTALPAYSRLVGQQGISSTLSLGKLQD